MEAIQFTEEQRRWAETSLQLGTIAKSLSGKQEEATNNNFIGESLIKNGYFDQTIPGSKSPILGNELVQNGNFEEKSAELITNGDFIDGTDYWDSAGGSTISVGTHQGRFDVADINITNTSTSSKIEQAFDYVNGQTYQVSVEVYLVSGSFRVDSRDSFVADDFVSTTTTGSWQTLTATITAIQTGTDVIWLRSDDEVSQFYVDSISIKQLDPNDRWTLDAGWSINNGKATCDGTQTGRSSLFQTGVLQQNVWYQFEFTLKDVTNGNVRLRNGIGASEIYISDKSLDDTYIVATRVIASNQTLVVDADEDFIGSVTNVSVKEIEAVDVDLWETVTNSLDSTIVFSEGFVTLDYDGGDGTLFIRQSDILTINDNYTVVIDYQMISGQGRVWVGTNYTDLTSTTRETKTFNAQALINDDFIIARKTNGQAMKMVVYSVAVYKIDNSDWTLQGNWSIVRGQGLKGAGVSGDFAFQSGTPAVATKTYRIEYKISSYTAGGVRVRFGNTFTDIVSSAGTFVQSIVASNTAYLEIISQEVGGSKFDGVIEYIKVQRGEQSDTLDMTDPSPKALWVVAPGNLKVTTMAGDVTTINGLEADTFIDWLRIKKVWLTGTTVSDIIGIY